jgi:hypothetical protein
MHAAGGRGHGWQQLLPLLPIVLLAFLSYHGNLWQAADGQWFAKFSQDSEQLVVDGLRHAQAEMTAVPGRYLQPSAEFEVYRSQFGLQVKVFAVLQRAGLRQAAQLQAVTALAMALVVAALFFFIRRDFGLRAAVAVAAVMLLSPWLVVFSRNLYWVTFTWFLPLLVAMAFAGRIFSGGRVLVAALALWFVVYLLKFLCGYEYLTAIFLAACVPLVHAALRQQRAFASLLRVVVLHGTALLLALLAAFVVHASSLPSVQGKSGWQQILLTAEKRLAARDPAQTAREACAGDADCVAVMQASLESNPLRVAAGYLLVPDLLPWTGSARDLTALQKQALRTALREPGRDSFTQLRTAVDNAALFSLLASRVLSPLCFLLLAAWACRRALRRGRVHLLTLLAAAAAPLSWFLLAKGHSYIHTHLNYVLWYLPFVMYALIALFAEERAVARGSSAQTSR